MAVRRGTEPGERGHAGPPLAHGGDASASSCRPRAAKSSPRARVALVPVERRARGREEHGVAGAGRARPRRAPRRASSRPGPPGPAPANAASTSPAASPIATTARTAARLRAQAAEVEALVAPPAMQHDALEAGRARSRWRAGSSPSSRRRTAPRAASPTSCDPVVEPPKPASGLRHRGGVGADDRVAAAAAASAFATSCGAPDSATGATTSGGTDQRAVAHAVVAGSRRPPVPTRITRPGAVGAPAPSATGVVARSTTSSVAGALVREDARLGRGVRGDRAVPVEVVLGDVEQHRDVGRERAVGRARAGTTTPRRR